jgi:hypothetical protein
MNAGLPISILRPMAFAAESIAFGKVDQLPVVKAQLISILCIMTVETPSHRFGVVELDIGVLFFQFSLLSIYLHRSMAIAAGVHPLGHRRRSIFFNDCQGRESEKKQQKH